jgi:hypothetical protein
VVTGHAAYPDAVTTLTLLARTFGWVLDPSGPVEGGAAALRLRPGTP